MAGDWIKMHRKTLKSAIAGDMELLGCWTWLLLNANWEERQLLDGTTIEPGQIMTGMDRLAAAWGCSKSTTHARTLKLEKLGMVNLGAASWGQGVHWA
jgi:hypothetical protein